ncbi:MAG: sensor histidine kinase, partial [Bacteroidales bacterium]
MTSLDYYSILAKNIPGLEVLLIDSSYEVLCKLGTEAQMQGWGEMNETHKSISTIFPKEIEEIINPLLKIGFESTPVSREFTANKNQFSVRIIPLTKSENQPLCILIIQNITETKLIEKKLQETTNEAKEANRAKDNFVAKMSHEIRTPLNAISGFTEQLKETRLTHQQFDYLQIVSNASKHLLSIINDILILSKIDLGRIDHDVETFKIGSILKEIDDVLKIKYKVKNLEFKIQCESLNDEFLIGEPSKLRQILINLANNALKFTRKGNVSIKCMHTKSTKHHKTIKFEITDTGIGIDTDEIKNIFKPFHQVDITHGRKYAGCGLGLTISKDLIESMGGTLEVDSTPGKGSTFSFFLNFRKASKSDIKS